MRFIFFILSLGLLMQTTAVNAQERDSALVAKVFKHGLNDSKKLLFSPTKWSVNECLLAGGITAATGALIAWGDQPVYNYTNTLHTTNLDIFFKYVQPMGNNYLYYTMSAFFLAGIITKDNYTVETSLIAAESFILTGVLCQAVKVTAGRTRPNNFDSSNPHQWAGPFFKAQSFFSGHTSAAFSVASVIAYRYRETVWVPVLSYSLATLGGMQRIYANRHWASDVLMGAAIGTATGIFLCKQWDENSIRFYPTLLPNGGGLSMVITLNSRR